MPVHTATVTVFPGYLAVWVKVSCNLSLHLKLGGCWGLPQIANHANLSPSLAEVAGRRLGLEAVASSSPAASCLPGKWKALGLFLLMRKTLLSAHLRI